MTEEIQYTIEFNIKDGGLDAFKELANNITNMVRDNEPDIKGYQWYFNDDETKCYIGEWHSSSETLLAHLQNVGGHAGARDPNPQALTIPGRSVEGLYGRSDFQRGVRCLGARGLTYDTWHYHHQNSNFADLARAIPETTMILDHFGTPLGVGVYADKREEIFEQWCKDITEIAECPNVVAKLGGINMEINGFAWHEKEKPPASDALLAATRPYYEYTIEQFGADRCMFESNFPVDKLSCGYGVLWNSFKRLSGGYSDDEKAMLFHDTAVRVYRLEA